MPNPEISDPVLAAHFYAPGQLDRAIKRVLAPAWREFLVRHPAFEGFLWFFRHDARSEHLKIQVHAAPDWAQYVPIFEELVKDGLEREWPLPAAATAPPTGALPLDEEDRRPEPPAAPFVPIRYQRHAVLVEGTGPTDDHEVALLCAGLGAGCGLLLELFDADHPQLESHRQNLLIVLFCCGLTGARAALEAKAEYLLYHRDCLIRSPVLWSGLGAAKGREIREIYDRETDKLPTAALQSVGNLVDSGASSILQPAQQDRAALFVEALAELAARDRGNAVPAEPFAPDRASSRLFRIFHLLANALGISKLDEGFVAHLLVRAAGRPADKDPEILPRSLELPGAGGASGRAFTPRKAAFEEDYAWQELIAVGCKDPEWMSAFRDQGLPIFQQSGRALGLLRQKELEAGRAMLHEVECKWLEIRKSHPSLHEALGRFYFGTLAYYHYMIDEDPKAADFLDEAGASVARAVGLKRFLLPMAPLVVDIPLQKARLARRRCRWEEMTLHLARLRDLESGESPLLELPGGVQVSYGSLESYFREVDLSLLQERHRRAIESLLVKEQRLGEFRRRCTEFYAPRYKLTPFP